jgi:hypothetical protein
MHLKLMILQVAFSSLRSPHFKTFIGAATEIADLPGFYVRIIPTANSLFNVSKLNISTRNNVRAYTKGDIPSLNMTSPIMMLISLFVFETSVVLPQFWHFT